MSQINAVIKSVTPKHIIKKNDANPIIDFSLMSFSSLNKAPKENFS
ncbi:uncharacterized protein METZ01_LOCUS208538 [marine metagenome]|uniref:Uncharacterized protein n=1 Tax=marine metagenome TaxID=408172 RepID=A0A382EZY8_9ZZZZ